ncbi:hypothetical protein C8R47DRAFT_1064282 [Mycena vitilis]|nr:hypothetical protein C8R47DRAFT_1064282 [Mycena vitilis]
MPNKVENVITPLLSRHRDHQSAPYLRHTRTPPCGSDTGSLFFVFLPPSTRDMAQSSRRSFPINITDSQGQHRPVASVGLSMLSLGTWGGAFAAVVGPIPYAVDGALKARPGLRLPTATTILRTSAPGFGFCIGGMFALFPPSGYLAGRLGFQPDSFEGKIVSVLGDTSSALFFRYSVAFTAQMRKHQGPYLLLVQRSPDEGRHVRWPRTTGGKLEARAQMKVRVREDASVTKENVFLISVYPNPCSLDFKLKTQELSACCDPTGLSVTQALGVYKVCASLTHSAVGGGVSKNPNIDIVNYHRLYATTPALFSQN